VGGVSWLLRAPDSMRWSN